VEGFVNVRELVQFTGVFQLLQDASFFAQVMADPELRTVSWPNDADFESDVLSAKVTGRPMPEHITANNAS
jgi:hypothetical protein